MLTASPAFENGICGSKPNPVLGNDLNDMPFFKAFSVGHQSFNIVL